MRMGIRNIEFVNGEYYHVFNRGVDKRSIFTTKAQQYFFFNRLKMLNSSDNSKKFNNQRNYQKGKEVYGDGNELVSVVAYCLLPNHYHLLVKQRVDNGISSFMQRLGTSYTKHFNEEESRSGSLFQGKFKATHLSGEFALSTLSAYVNLNFKHHKIDPKNQLVKTSLFEYFNEELGDRICDQAEIGLILAESGGLTEYKKMIKNASISFADNKNIFLSSDDFEF
jgi:REP element-mobilizing transposase RayT